VYPEGCNENPSKEALPIVRNPGPVRDVAVPFSLTLKTDALANGWSTFVRTVDDFKSSAGNTDRPVRLVDVPMCSTLRVGHNPVKQASVLVSPSFHSQDRALAYDIPDQNDKYGCSIAKELEYLRLEYEKCDRLPGGTDAWAACVAVLLPGVRCSQKVQGWKGQDISTMLLAATRRAAKRERYSDVLAALPEAVSAFNRTSMYV
jgi:hypothetical protein